LTYHVKRDHQSSVKVKFKNGAVTEVKKREDGTFTCKCGKKFNISVTLRKHAKTCRGEPSESEDIHMEDVNMMEGNSDASGIDDHDERQVNNTVVDCYGALISREKC
jgi:hypothetical protein